MCTVCTYMMCVCDMCVCECVCLLICSVWFVQFVCMCTMQALLSWLSPQLVLHTLLPLVDNPALYKDIKTRDETFGRKLRGFLNVYMTLLPASVR